MLSLSDLLADIGTLQEGPDHWCPPPPPGRTPIGALAPELLARILAGDDDMPPSCASSFALVCRAWREPAQEFRWRHIALFPADAKYFGAMADSPACGRYRTLSVSVLGLGAMGGYEKQLDRLFRKLRGVEEVTLNECQRVDPALFAAAPTFTNLKLLRLQLCDFEPFPSTFLTFPFRLDHLELTGDIPPSLVSSLLATAPATLSFEMDPFGIPNPSLVSGLPLIAPSLRRLTLAETNPAYIPLLDGCTSLEHLHLTSHFNVVHVIEALAIIPANLSKLSIGVDVDEDGMGRLMANLKLKLVTGQMGKVCLAQLKTLEVVFEGLLGEWDILPGAGEVERRCKAAGVTLVFDRDLCDEEDDE